MNGNTDAINKLRSEAAAQAEKNKQPAQGGRLCICGRVNTEVTGTCVCGTTKKDANTIFSEKKREEIDIQRQYLNKKRQEIRAKHLQKKDLDQIDILGEYRELLDSGILSREEFEKKKNEWLELTR